MSLRFNVVSQIFLPPILQKQGCRRGKKYKRPLSSQDAVHARFKSFVANSLDPDQAQYFVGPDLDPNWLTLR